MKQDIIDLVSADQSNIQSKKKTNNKNRSTINVKQRKKNDELSFSSSDDLSISYRQTKKGGVGKAKAKGKVVSNSSSDENPSDVLWMDILLVYQTKEIIKVVYKSTEEIQKTRDFYFLFTFGSLTNVLKFMIEHVLLMKDTKSSLLKLQEKNTEYIKRIPRGKGALKMIYNEQFDTSGKLTMKDITNSGTDIVFGNFDDETFLYHYVKINQKYMAQILSKVVLLKREKTDEDDEGYGNDIFYYLYVPPSLISNGKTILDYYLKDMKSFLQKRKQDSFLFYKNISKEMNMEKSGKKRTRLGKKG